MLACSAALQSTSVPANMAHSGFRIVNEKLIWRDSKAEVGVRGAAGGTRRRSA